MSKPIHWLILLIAAVAILGSAASLPLHAQSLGIACLDDCPQISAGPPIRSIINIYGCLVRITWATRTGCNGYRDIVIQKVEHLTPGCAGIMGPGACSNLAQYWLLQQVMGAYIPAPTFPHSDTCVNWRVLKPACWHWDVECEDSVAIPCDSFNCCVSYWRACQDLNGTKTLIRVGDGITNSCDTLWNGDTCDFACDDTSNVIYPSRAPGGGPDPIEKAKREVPPSGDPVGGSGKKPEGLQAVPRRE